MKIEFRRGKWYLYDEPNPFRVFDSEEEALAAVAGPVKEEAEEELEEELDFGDFEAFDD